MTDDAKSELIGRALGFIDDGDIAALIEMLEPGVVWKPPRQGTLDDAYEGHDGVRRLFGQLTEAWDEIEHSPIKLVEGNEVTIVVTHIKLHAQASGLDVDEVWAYVVGLNGDKFHYVEMYTDPEQAVREHSGTVLDSAPNWPGAT
jgi:ketosteroid isomerase-like protein